MDSYHIVPHARRHKCWAIVRTGAKRALQVHRSKLKAISMGIKLGKIRNRDVYLHKRDGTVSKKLYEMKEAE